MITCDDAVIEKMVVHRVGNKTNNEPLKISPCPFLIHGEIGSVLLKYFTSNFKSPQTYHLFSEAGVDKNLVYQCVKEIFNDENELYSQSVKLAQYLYEVSEHPNIKSGELYITRLSQCFIDGDVVDAVGIFKSENKETYLKVFPKGDGFDIESESGININKLDKGCIIFNKEQEEGYVAIVVDVSNKNGEAAYWTDGFLGLAARHDSFFNTEHAINLCRGFVTEYLPSEYEMTKADQAELLSKTSDYMKEYKQFDVNKYANDVIGNNELQEKFEDYRFQYEKDFDMDFSDNFAISEQAFRKGQRGFRSILKLDKNFTVYIHGSHNRIEQGEDEDTGLKYYKFLYDNEN